MAQTFEAQKAIRGCYILKEETLRRIAKHLASTGGTFRVTLKFRNERTITSNDIDEILNDSLIGSTKIDELRLRATSAPDTVAEVIFANRSAAMAYGIRGDRQLVLALEHEVLSEFNSGKLWYSNLNPDRGPVQMNVSTAISVFLLASGLTAFMTIWFGDWLFRHLSLVLYVALGFSVLSVIGNTLLPALQFGFGKGLESYRRRGWILNLTFGTVMLGIAVGLITTFLSGKLGIAG